MGISREIPSSFWLIHKARFLQAAIHCTWDFGIVQACQICYTVSTIKRRGHLQICAGRGWSKHLRIIAGEARGRTLVAPKGMDTRPTLDRVRESLFNILRPYLLDAVVLDLFAGSGALGFESLSRGARQAVFADHARAAQEAVLRNMETLRMGDRARLLKRDWRAALRQLQAERLRFDLVFLDPPYQMEQAGEMLVALRQGSLLHGDSLVVYEHALDNPPDTALWEVADMRKYGDTAITFLALPAQGGQDENGSVSGQL